MRCRFRRIILALFVAIVFCMFVGCAKQLDSDPKYGVFIGASPEQLHVSEYDIVVIDAAYYSKADIDNLHQNNTIVYSYLNVGSIESFRDFFSKYQYLILGEYEDWPGEYWVDVSSTEWQNHIYEYAGFLVEKGIDGFFIDNADVYYQYQTLEIFQGMVSILNMLSQYDKDIYINGGDVFVTKAVLESASPLVQITGVNQECVFTNIDFAKGLFVKQATENTKYYQEYIEKCGDRGLDVYLLEYCSDDALYSSIEKYCDMHEFGYYISSSLDLQ